MTCDDYPAPCRRDPKERAGPVPRRQLIEKATGLQRSLTWAAWPQVQLQRCSNRENRAVFAVAQASISSKATDGPESPQRERHSVTLRFDADRGESSVRASYHRGQGTALHAKRRGHPPPACGRPDGERDGEPPRHIHACGHYACGEDPAQTRRALTNACFIASKLTADPSTRRGRLVQALEAAGRAPNQTRSWSRRRGSWSSRSRSS